jgi:mannose-1-phosphate guanylyltransferase
MKHVAVIMAGGAGERFWPLSRQHYPKQLLRIAGNRSMLAASVERIAPLVPPEDIFVITGACLQAAIRAESCGIPPENVIAEPEGRNTAACLALAVALMENRYADEPDTVMAVLTADHSIRDTAAFAADFATAFACAEAHPCLFTFGIPPSRPETGYGYVETGEPLAGDPRVRRVLAFREKPDLNTAVEYLATGRHLWNSGMFVWRTSVLREAFRVTLPEAHDHLDALREALSDSQEPGSLAPVFARLPKISIDYGVLERAANVAVVRASFDWDDVGTWASVSRLLPADAAGNVSFGKCLLSESANCTVYSVGESRGPDDGRFVVGFGVADLVIVSTADAVLVFPRERAQQVKDIVALLRREGLEEYL